MHKHMIDNASLMSENMDWAEVGTKWRRTVAARCLKQVRENLGYSALWPSIHHTIGQSRRNAFIHLHHVCSLHAFCHLTGATGESWSQIHAQKQSTSETRRSFSGWRGWHARLLIHRDPPYLSDVPCNRGKGLITWDHWKHQSVLWMARMWSSSFLSFTYICTSVKNTTLREEPRFWTFQDNSRVFANCYRKNTLLQMLLIT